MHPAKSIVFFTVVSGAGYGLLVLLGVGAGGGLLAPRSAAGLTGLATALALVSLGLLSSMFHLGHPGRAWRALTQWRSSWLSSEGVASLATYVPAAGFGICVYGGAMRWAGVFGVAMALFAATTVVCTAMIYRSLKPVHQWHNRFVLPIYLMFALSLGALWLVMVLRLSGAHATPPLYLAGAAVLATAALKLRYWSFVDATAGVPSPESATGLGRFGAVRLFEAPHTGSNYLMKDMDFAIARRHAGMLRRLVVVVGFSTPVILLALAAATSDRMALVFVILAALAGTIGALIERWLFFAEARHSVTLYYGASRT